jgi:epoxyqueuosine reductase
VAGPSAAEVKARALSLGFDLCGIAAARALDRRHLQSWLDHGWDAGLGYMRERVEERLDPRLLLPGARSVIALAASYGPDLAITPAPDLATTAAREANANARLPMSRPPGSNEPLTIARYAQGRDYHNVLLKRARKLAAWLRTRGAQVYAAVDAGAVAEKAWAQEAGLGWIGKNGMLINPAFGSWLLLGALVTDLALAPDAPHPERCGECTACLPACPTDAIREDRLVDSNRCLAFHTIEHRGPIPEAVAGRAGGRIFGCDACQEACPWNRRARTAVLVQLRSSPAQRALALEDALSLTHAETERRFAGTPLMRAGRDGLVRSALAVAARPLTGRARELAEQLRTDSAEGVRAEAARALDL